MSGGRYDVIVIGLGAMGAAATYQLAKAGVTVLGIDRYAPPHAFGSTHGDTRITRLAVGEGAQYAPLVRRSHEIWRDIERRTGRQLLHECGGLVMARQRSQGQHGVPDFVGGTLAVATAHGVDHEVLDTGQIRQRFPQLAVTDEHGYYEAGSGYVVPEECVAAQLQLAGELGATVRTGETVRSWSSDGGTVEVVTDRGTYSAGSLVLAAGPWMASLVPELAPHLTVHRQVLYWFDIADRSAYERYRDMPVYIWMHGPGAGDFLYGFPAIDGPDGGIKIAVEQYGAGTSPDAVDREVTELETRAMYEQHVRHLFAGLGPTCLRSASCLYTVTPDFQFVLDLHPGHANVVLASPCSGHGFKHSAAIGEVLAQLATNGESTTDISSFSLRRFA